MRRRALTAGAGLILIMLWAGACLAQEAEADGRSENESLETSAPFVLDPVVVSARGRETTASETPGSVGVVGEDEIALKQPLSVSNAASVIPGVSKASDSAWGSEINIRGLSREAVVFLIDGCRVNTATDINAQYGLIDPEEVERIEILKGPISSLYGSGSIGGVVNVLTKTGHFTEEEAVSGTVSSSGTVNPDGFRNFAGLLYDSPKTYVYGSQSYRSFHSYEDGGGHTVRNSQFEDYQSKLKVGRKLNDLNTTEGQFQYYEGKDIGIPGSGTAPLPTAADVTYPYVRRGLFNVVHTYNPQHTLLTDSRLNLYYQYIDRRALIDNFPAAAPVNDIFTAADHETYGGKWENEFKFSQHTLMVGPDIWRRSLTSNRTRRLKSGMEIREKPLPDAEFVSSGFFAEDTWAATDQLKLNAGARFDYINVDNEETKSFAANDVDDRSWNGHLGATYAISEDWDLKGIAARGYRAASIEERFAFLDLGNGVTKLGDPNLDPEESNFYELGVGWHKEETISAGVSVFYNDLRNLIAEQFVNPTTIVNANVSEAEIKGIEGEVKYNWNDFWQLFANVSYAQGRDTFKDQDLPGIPSFHGIVGSRINDSEGWFGYTEFVFAMQQNETPENVPSAPGWQTINLRVGREFNWGRTRDELWVGVDNLFDKEYRDYLSTSRGVVFNEPGRSLLAGVRVSF